MLSKAPARKLGKWLFAAAILAVLIVAATVYYSYGTPAAEYVTARADRGDIDSTVTTTGNLNAVITVQVGSQVSGNIIALYADFNTRVKKGQLVAEIDPAPFRAAVDQAKATLNAAKAAVITAQATLAKTQADRASAEANVASQKANLVKARSAAELARIQSESRRVLVETGSTSREDADSARANADQAAAGVDAARAAIVAAEASAESAHKAVEVAANQLEGSKAVVEQDAAILAQAQLNLDHTRILAPVDGTVQSRNMDVGQTVAASFQAPVIFLIAQDLTKMQVDTNVDESDVGPIRLDQPATFLVDAYAGQTFKGKVAQIRKAPINVQNVVTYDVVVAVSNPDLKLFPGMTANVTILTGQARNVLRVPKAALRFRPRNASKQSAQVVYVLDSNGQPQAISVTTGLSDANRVEITSGDLTEGRAVVTGTVSKTGTAPASTPKTGGTKKFGI